MRTVYHASRQTKFRAWLSIAGLAVVMSLYLNGKHVLKKIPGVDYFTDNSSYLASNTYRESDTNWFSVLVGYDSATGFDRSRLLADSVEESKVRGRYNLGDQAAYHHRYQQMSQDALGEVYRHASSTQTKKATQGLQKESENNENIRPLRTPAAVMAGMVMIYSGKTIKYSLSDSFKLSSKTKMTQNRLDSQRLTVDSDVIGTLFEYVDTASPTQENQGGESMKVSVYRDIKPVGMRAIASYGTTSNSTTLGVSKSVTENLNVSYGQTRGGTMSGNQSVGVGFSQGF